jgi:hypothetical protein
MAMEFSGSDDVHLRRAGALLVLELVMVLAWAVISTRFGFASHLALLLVMAVNLIAAACLARAARARGRSAWGYGLFSAVMPVAAFYAWMSLYQRDAVALREASMRDAVPDRCVDADGVVHERSSR